MSTVTTEFCPACGVEREFRHETRSVEQHVRSETIAIALPLLICTSCGTEEVDPAAGIDPRASAFVEYRTRHGLLTPEQIKSIRKQYGLSQKSFAALLGMSEATINRYERGALQDASHDTAIRACQQPAFVRSLVPIRGARLSSAQLAKLMDASP